MRGRCVRGFVFCFGVGAAVVFAEIAVVADEPNYRFALIDLGDLGGDDSGAFGISDSGDVVGNGRMPNGNDYHAVLFQDGDVIDLGTFGGDTSTCTGINGLGEIVGVADNPVGDIRAFLWRDGVMMDLGSLGGAWSYAESINEQGKVVGAAALPGENSHAFLWEDGVMTDLGAFRGISSATEINDANQVAGMSNVNDDRHRVAVLWQDGEMIDLEGLYPTGSSEARALNDSGNIVGYANNEKGRSRAVIWVDGHITNLQFGTPGFKWSEARGINNQNQIVGWASTYLVQFHGVLWEPFGEGMQLLDDLVAPNLDVQISLAFDINEHSQIVGVAAENETFRSHAILLTPVSPEMELSDPVPGIAGELNVWTITDAVPGSKVTLTYSLKGGGTLVPGCDELDAVLQIKKAKVMRTATADGDGVATFKVFVPKGAGRFGQVLLQAVSFGECQESQLSVVEF